MSPQRALRLARKLLATGYDPQAFVSDGLKTVLPGNDKATIFSLTGAIQHTVRIHDAPRFEKTSPAIMDALRTVLKDLGWGDLIVVWERTLPSKACALFLVDATLAMMDVDAPKAPTASPKLKRSVCPQ